MEWVSSVLIGPRFIQLIADLIPTSTRLYLLMNNVEVFWELINVSFVNFGFLLWILFVNFGFQTTLNLVTFFNLLSIA